jgi:hypothetical protein
METVTLEQSLEWSATEVYLVRRKAAENWADGAALFDKAVAHHKARRLRANVKLGTTRDRDGWRSRYVDYDWASDYEQHPSFVFHDFFRGAILNSIDRMARGLEP